MKRTDRIKLFFQITFQLLLVGAAIVGVFTQNWIHVLIACIALLLTYVPSIIERQYEINLPNAFEFIVLGFLYLSLYLGEIQNFYIIFGWWDVFLHTVSGFILGVLGLALVNTLNENQVSIQLSPGFVAIFAVTFAMSIGVFWEIFEFIMDTVFGLNMQKSGIVDTMTDLIVDAIGAIVSALLGYWYLKTDPQFITKLERFLLRGVRR